MFCLGFVGTPPGMGPKKKKPARYAYTRTKVVMLRCKHAHYVSGPTPSGLVVRLRNPCRPQGVLRSRRRALGAKPDCLTNRRDLLRHCRSKLTAKSRWYYNIAIANVSNERPAQNLARQHACNIGSAVYECSHVRSQTCMLD